MKKKIIPAILTRDVSDLENKLKKLKGLSDRIQIDIADGKFVDNTSIRLKDLSKSKLSGSFNLEAHLMVLDPEKYFPECQKADIKTVIFHLEAAKNAADTLMKAKNFDFQKGIALNPETPITGVLPYLGKADVILLLAVRPGFQGQTFIPSVLDKIRKLRNTAPQIKIEVDGGINLGNIKEVAGAGADYLVVGSDLFRGNNIKKHLAQLKEKIA